MKSFVFYLCLFLLITSALTATNAVEVLQSPNGKTALSFELRDRGGLRYGVSYCGKPILIESRLGIIFQDAPPLEEGFQIIERKKSHHDQTWKPAYGERNEIRDRYNQWIVDLKENQAPHRRLQLIFRAYDEGIAFCYTLPEQETLQDITIQSEKTQFRFTAPHYTWPVYSAQGAYEKTRIDDVKSNCERPLTVKIEDGPFVAIGEARLVDYARMRLQPVPENPHTLESQLASPVTVSAPYTTPWRFLMIADTPDQLIERNYLILNLNDPCEIEDTSWIKPGKVIREVTLTTEGGKACVDFAVEHGLQYIEYDAGWYGNERSESSDARTVSRNPKKSGVKGELDLHEVIRYADQHGIGVIVYVNRIHLERQLDEILPLYRSWGIKGVKYGFVQVGSQQWTRWLHEAVRKAAANHLMVDIHDEYRPTGYSRTYPNLLTQEGIRGNEEMPPAENTLILPFTRGLCGAGDYTVCWNSTRIKTTHAFQLATPVVFYSPFQFLFWYDRPQQIKDEPELEFWKTMPVVWDETHVIQGSIGEYITMARRTGDEWYIGSLNAVRQRALEISLSFLPSDQKFTASIYSDADPQGASPRKVSIQHMTVDSTSIIKADLAANGGQAVHLSPQ